MLTKYNVSPSAIVKEEDQSVFSVTGGSGPFKQKIVEDDPVMVSADITA